MQHRCDGGKRPTRQRRLKSRFRPLRENKITFGYAHGEDEA